MKLFEDPLTRGMVRTRKGSFGNELSYVEAAHYVGRLNDAFEGQWSFKILGHENQGTEVMVHGVLEAAGPVRQQLHWLARFLAEQVHSHLPKDDREYELLQPRPLL
jgi:hypothetical protein